MRQDSKRVVTYDVIRVVATLLVVISHAAYIKSMTAYGGVDYSTMAEGRGYMLSAALLLSRFLYKFHMQLYMALSGALFVGTLSRKTGTFSSFIKDKTKRLLIPYFAVSLFYSLPIKYLSGYYSSSSNIIKAFFVGRYCCRGILIYGFCLRCF